MHDCFAASHFWTQLDAGFSAAAKPVNTNMNRKTTESMNLILILPFFASALENITYAVFYVNKIEPVSQVLPGITG
jgi:uncharacterized membrane protein YpjA